MFKLTASVTDIDKFNHLNHKMRNEFIHTKYSCLLKDDSSKALA